MNNNFQFAMWCLRKHGLLQKWSSDFDLCSDWLFLFGTILVSWALIGWCYVYNNKEEFTSSSVSFLVSSSKSTKWPEILHVGLKKIESLTTLISACGNVCVPNALFITKSTIFRQFFFTQNFKNIFSQALSPNSCQMWQLFSSQNSQPAQKMTHFCSQQKYINQPNYHLKQQKWVTVCCCCDWTFAREKLAMVR